MAEPNVNLLFNARPRGRSLSDQRWPVAALLGVLLALPGLAGCRHIDNAQVDVLESELRKQEDYIYELEEYLIEYSEKLRQARMAQCDPAVVPQSTPSGSSIKEPTLDVDAPSRPRLPMNGREKLAPSAKPTLPNPADSEAPPATLAPPPTFESDDPSPAEEISPEDMEAPGLEIGPGVQSSPTMAPPTLIGSATPSPIEDAPLLIPDPVDYQADDEFEVNAAPTAVADVPAIAPMGDVADAPLLTAPRVEGPRLSADHLQIRRIFSERDAANPESLGSLLVVMEALNATDEPVGADGAASLMIMARDDAGAMRRIERWDFTAQETAAAWQSSQLGDGLHLELPLAKSPIADGELELWARVVTDDGRKLLTQIPLEPSQLASMADFTAEEALTVQAPVRLPTTPIAEPTIDEEPRAIQVAVAPITKTAAEEPKPTWKASSIRLNENRIEGYATTAGAPAARVASTATESSAKPTWKKSSTAAAASETKRDWAPFR